MVHHKADVVSPCVDGRAARTARALRNNDTKRKGRTRHAARQKKRRRKTPAYTPKKNTMGPNASDRGNDRSPPRRGVGGEGCRFASHADGSSPVLVGCAFGVFDACCRSLPSERYFRGCCRHLFSNPRRRTFSWTIPWNTTCPCIARTM